MNEQYDLCWDVRAGERLKEIYEYISENYSEISAEKVRKDICAAVETLVNMPERYPREPMLAHLPENYRYILVRKMWRIIYEFTGNEIRILYIHNMKQNPQNIVKAIEE